MLQGNETAMSLEVFWLFYLTCHCNTPCSKVKHLKYQYAAREILLPCIPGVSLRTLIFPEWESGVLVLLLWYLNTWDWLCCKSVKLLMTVGFLQLLKGFGVCVICCCFFTPYLLVFQSGLWKLLMLLNSCLYLPTASCSYFASFIIRATSVFVSRWDISLRILQAARAEATPSWPCKMERCYQSEMLNWGCFTNE